MISARVAFILYAALAGFAVWKLHGTPFLIALAIILGVAVKTLVDVLRRRLDG